MHLLDREVLGIEQMGWCGDGAAVDGRADPRAAVPGAHDDAARGITALDGGLDADFGGGQAGVGLGGEGGARRRVEYGAHHGEPIVAGVEGVHIDIVRVLSVQAQLARGEGRPAVDPAADPHGDRQRARRGVGAVGGGAGQGVEADGLRLPAQHDGVGVGRAGGGTGSIGDRGAGLGGPRPVLGQLGGPAVDDGEALLVRARRVGEDVVDARGGGRVGVGYEDEAVPGDRSGHPGAGAADELGLRRGHVADEGRVAGRAGVAEVALLLVTEVGQRPQVAPVDQGEGAGPVEGDGVGEL